MNEPSQASSRTVVAPGWIGRVGEILTRDYGRRHDRFLKWARDPLIILILAAIASALCGLCLQPQGFVLSFGLAALLIVGIVWPWLSVSGLGGTLGFERSRSREGESVQAYLRLVNRRPWGAWGLSVQAGLGEQAEVGLSRAIGWKRTEVCWDFTPDRRGVYPEGVPRIASGFPFGLSSSSRALEVSSSLLVWPRTFAVGPIPIVSGGHFSEGTATRNRPGGSGDFLGVRPYRRGDSLRRVHWPQTARLGQMVVCELQSNAVPRVQIVVDVDPARHVGAGPEGSREWAIRVAASFVEGWIGQGAEVELVVEGQAIPARGGSVERRRAGLLDALARVGRSGGTSLPELLELPACRNFSHGLRVVVATDLAVEDLGARASKHSPERFVILKASAFGDSYAPEVDRPWIWIDDPARVAHQVRRGWKEVVLDR